MNLRNPRSCRFEVEDLASFTPAYSDTWVLTEPQGFSVAPASLTFSNVIAATTATQTVTVTNTSTSTISLTAINVAGSGFSLSSPPALPLALAPNATQTFTVAFTPPSAGNYSGTFTVFTDFGVQTGALTGTSIAGPVTLTPATYDFGNVSAPGTAGTTTATITNSTGGSITVTAIGVTGTGFSVTGLPTLPLTMINGATATFTVSFAPAVVGAASGTVSVTTSAATKTMSVTGTGVTPPVTITTPTAIGTWSVGDHEFGLTATGGNGTFAWTLTGGALPPGMVLRTDKPSYFAASVNGNLSGVVTATGDYSFTLTATSGTASTSKTFTVKVVALRPMDMTSGLPDAFVGVPFSYQLTPLDNAGPVTWTTTTSLPAWLTLTPSGLLTGTPTASGSINVYPTLNDGINTVAWQHSHAITVFSLRFTSPDLLPNATLYLPYSTKLTADGGTGPYTFTTTSTLPAGITLASDGTLSGTPTGSVGRVGMSVTVTDSASKTYTRRISFVVIGAPEQLIYLARGGNGDTCMAGGSCSLGIQALNGGTAPFTYTATGLPAGMGIRWGGGNTSTNIYPNDAELWGNPLTPNTYSVTVVATDANGKKATQIFDLNVAPIFLQDGLSNGTRGTAYSKTMRVVGGTGSYSATLASTSVLPAGLTLSGLTVSGTPTENGSFVPVFVFTDSASMTLRSGIGLVINNPTGNTISISSGPNFTYTKGAAFSTQLAACCATTYRWSSVGALPSGVSLSTTGLLSGTAAAVTGNFVVRAEDGSNATNAGQKQMSLLMTPFAISSGNTLPNGNVGTSYSTTLVATGGTGASTWALMPFYYLPPGLTLTSGGVLSGTPSQTGYYQFMATVTDQASNARTFTFYVQIFAAGATAPLQLNQGPTITTALVGPQTITLTAAGGTPPYHFSYTPGATPIPGMRVQDGQPLPTGFLSTTTGGFLGVITNPGYYTTSLRVTDSATPANVFDRPIWWTIYDLATLNQASVQKGTVGTFYSLTLQGYGGSGNYSWSATSIPAGLALNGNVISGTPTTAANSSPTIVKITDLTDNSSASYSASIAVNAFPIATNGVLPMGTMNSVYPPLTFSAPGCVATCTWSGGGTLPTGMSLSAAGVLSGTPTAAYNSSFLVQAVGSTSGTVTKQVSLIIKYDTPQPLYISQSATPTPTNVGALVSVALTGVQGGTPPYNWSLDSGALPDGVSLAGPGDVVGAFLYPGSQYLAGRTMRAGLYSFTLKATDSASPANTTTRTFSWRVLPVVLGYTSLPITGTTLVLNQSYTQQLLVYGGSGVYPSWTVASGFLPPGLILNPTTGLITGIPTNTGSFTAGIQVVDDAGATALQNVTFTVAASTAVTINTGLADSYIYQLGVSYSSSGITPSGGTGPYTFTPLTPYPPGCAIQYGSTSLINLQIGYVLECSPLAAGDYPVTVQVTDSVGNIGVRTVTIHIVPFSLYTSTTLSNASLNVPYNQTILVNDNTTTPSFTLASGSAMPPGLSLVGNLITGTPSKAGNFAFGILASDPAGYTITYNMTLVVSTLNIQNPDVIPVIARYNEPFTYTMTASGGGAVKTWSATSLPSGITMSTSGVLSGTPTSTGVSRINVTVTDGSSSYTHPFTLYLAFVYPALPNMTIQSTMLADARVGSNVNYSLNQAGGTPPYTWTVASGSSLPPGLRLLRADTLGQSNQSNTVGVTYLVGSPSTPGLYTFDLIGTDSANQTLRRTFTLNVAQVTILYGGVRNATIGVQYNQQLTAAGGTAPYTFTYSPSSIFFEMLPPGITASSSGLISGIAATSGSFSFYATVSDSSVPAKTFRTSYTLNVTNASGLYVLSGIPTLTLGRSISSTLSAGTGSTYTWSVSAGALPPGLTFSSAGTLGGIPTVAGAFTFTLRATDNANSANYADRLYTGVQVNPMQLVAGRANMLPVGRVGSPFNYVFKVTGGTAPYTFTTSPIYPLPPGLSLSSDGVLSGIPKVSGNFNYVFYLADATGKGGYITTNYHNILDTGQVNPIQGTVFSLRDGYIGVPYASPLALATLGGVPVVSYALAAGSVMPPGLSLVQGGNGAGAYVVGVPTTAGKPSFTLVATDGAGHTADVNASVAIWSMAVSPVQPRHASVNVPYSQTFTASGGTAPYTFTVPLYGSMPAGLSLSSSGVLSGTPTSSGFFTVWMSVTDNVGATLNMNYQLVVDSKGTAQGIGIGADVVQMTYVRTAPAPSAVPIPVTSTFGTIPFTALVAGIPGASLSSVSGNAPATLNLNLDPATAVAGTYSGVVAVAAPTSANGFVEVPVILTVSDPPPCSYTVNPASSSIAAGAGGGSFTVATGSLCTWSASTASTWLHVTSGAGPGTGTVSFTADANPDLNQRSGTITAGGQAYTVTQFGSSCSYAISPNYLQATAAGGVASINVTTSNQACTWTATGMSSTPASGTGNGQVSVTIPQNLAGTSVHYTATIAGQAFSADQSGANCSVTLGAPGAAVGSAAATGGVTVSMPAGCSYSTVNGPSWITVTGGASGSGPYPATLTYSVAPNSSTAPRTGSLGIGDQTFTITQDATACSVTVDASTVGSPYGVSSGAGYLTVTTNGANCSWSASSNSAWATVAPISGSGNGVVNVNVTSNAGSLISRSANLTVAGQTVPITQSGTTCTYSLNSSQANVPYGSGNGSVMVSAPSVCSWSAVTDPTAPWLSVTSGSSGNGTSGVNFVASVNTTSASRSGVLTIAGKPFTVTQGPAPCDYTLSGSNTTVASDGAPGSFTFQTGATGCSANAVSYSGWLTVSTTSLPDGTSGTVNFTAAKNNAGSQRTGTIQFAGQTFTVTQTGATCAYSLNAYAAAFNKSGGGSQVQASATASGCTPTYGTDQPSIVTLGNFTGPLSNIFTLQYNVGAFNSMVTSTRRMNIVVGGRVLVLKQTSW